MRIPKKDLINKKTYNRIAEIYTTKHFDSKVLKENMDKFLVYLAKDSKILDLGCGPGQCAGYFVENGFSVTGIDFSDKMIEIAKSKVPKANFICANVLEYDLGSEIYDAIWSNAVLLHFRTTEIGEILAKMHKALKKDGVIYVSFMEGSGERLFSRVDRGVKDIRVFIDRSIEEAKSLITDANFEVIDENYSESPIVTFFGFYAKKA